MPDVLNDLEIDANAELAGLGLIVLPKTEQYHISVPLNRVISSTPDAGEVLYVGDPVTLHVSQGNLKPIPDVVGLTQTPAENLIVAEGFTVGDVTSAFSALPPGQVISQNPTYPNNLILLGDIHIELSDGLPVTDVLEVNNNEGDKKDVKSGQAGAQSFKHTTVGGQNYEISKVVIKLSRESDVTQNFLFTIGTGVNSGPLTNSSKSIAAGVVDSSGASTFSTHVITLSPPVTGLISGTTYYLNFDTPDEKVYYLSSDSDGYYGDGEYFKGGGPDGKDIYFEITGVLLLGTDDDSDNGAPLAAASAAGAELAPAMLSASGVEQTANHAPTVRSPARSASTISGSSRSGSTLSVESKSARHARAVAAGGGNLRLLILKARLRQATSAARQGQTLRAQKLLQTLVDELDEILLETQEKGPKLKQLRNSATTQLKKLVAAG